MTLTELSLALSVTPAALAQRLAVHGALLPLTEEQEAVIRENGTRGRKATLTADERQERERKARKRRAGKS